MVVMDIYIYICTHTYTYYSLSIFTNSCLNIRYSVTYLNCVFSIKTGKGNRSINSRKFEKVMSHTQYR